MVSSWFTVMGKFNVLAYRSSLITFRVIEYFPGSKAINSNSSCVEIIESPILHCMLYWLFPDIEGRMESTLQRGV